MHLNLTKHERFCKQNNQLPTESHDESKDNSIMPKNLPNHLAGPSTLRNSLFLHLTQHCTSQCYFFFKHDYSHRWMKVATKHHNETRWANNRPQRKLKLKQRGVWVRTFIATSTPTTHVGVAIVNFVTFQIKEQIVRQRGKIIMTTYISVGALSRALILNVLIFNYLPVSVSRVVNTHTKGERWLPYIPNVPLHSSNIRVLK